MDHSNREWGKKGHPLKDTEAQKCSNLDPSDGDTENDTFPRKTLIKITEILYVNFHIH